MYRIFFELALAICLMFGSDIVLADLQLDLKFREFQKQHKDTVKTLAAGYQHFIRCQNRPSACHIGHNIVMQNHEFINLICPGENNYFEKIPGKNFLRFQCLCEDVLMSGTRFYSVNDIRCKYNETQDIFERSPLTKMLIHTKEEIVEITSNNYKHYEVGFVLNNGENFLKMMDIVNDEINGRAHYVQSVVRANTIINQELTINMDLANPKYCSHEVEDILKYFDPLSEENSFTLQLTTHAERQKDITRSKIYHLYLDKDTDKILIPMYMASPISTADPLSLLATNTLLNMAVQWKSIKEGNWAAIENHINEMSFHLKRDLTVITGVYQNLVLEDPVSERMMNMYLFAKELDNKKLKKLIPIPKYFIKIVIDAERKTGITFVTVNNPYIKSGQRFQLCDEPIVNKFIKWPTYWEPENYKLGYSYACHVGDFLQKTNFFMKDQVAAGIEALLFMPNIKLKDFITGNW